MVRIFYIHVKEISGDQAKLWSFNHFNNKDQSYANSSDDFDNYPGEASFCGASISRVPASTMRV